MRTAGYVVLDEGCPVSRTQCKDGKVFYFPQRWFTTTPISIFPTRVAAARIRRVLRKQHQAMAACFDPNGDEDQQRCQKLWADRAETIRVRSVVSDEGAINR